jgi:hypothetical protein
VKGPDLGGGLEALMTASLMAECRRESTPFTLIRGFDERLLRRGPDRLYVMPHKMQHESRMFIRFQRVVGHASPASVVALRGQRPAVTKIASAQARTAFVPLDQRWSPSRQEWTTEAAIAPSPTADATRLIEPWRRPLPRTHPVGLSRDTTGRSRATRELVVDTPIDQSRRGLPAPRATTVFDAT